MDEPRAFAIDSNADVPTVSSARRAARPVHDRDELLGPDPVVRELDAAGPVDRVEHRLRPQVLDEHERRAHVLRQRLGDAEDVVLVEEVAVGELGRAGDRAFLDPGRSEAL